MAAAAAAGAVCAAVAAVYVGTLPPGLPGGDAGNVPSTHRGAGTGAGGPRLGRTGGWLWGGGTGGRSELCGCCHPRRDVCPVGAGAFLPHNSASCRIDAMRRRHPVGSCVSQLSYKGHWSQAGRDLKDHLVPCCVGADHPIGVPQCTGVI